MLGREGGLVNVINREGVLLKCLQQRRCRRNMCLGGEATS